MQLLNYLYFLIISLMGVRYLTTTDGKIVAGALDKTEKFRFNNVELFWTLTFSTGLLAFYANAGLDLSAIRLMVLIVLCIAGIFISKEKVIWSPALKIYGLYLIWIFIGCFYAPSWGYGIRVILKYSYPLLLCLFASSSVRDPEVFLKSSFLARLVAVVSIIFHFVPYIGHIVPGVFMYGTGLAINYISMTIFSLSLFYFTTAKKKNLLYAILFMLPCFLWVLRTSIMGTLIALMAFAFIRYKTKSFPIISGILIAGVIAVFSIPSLREKMFFENGKDYTVENFQDGKITMDDVNTNTRSFMWERLEHYFFEDHEIIGSGTGAVQQYMYTHSKEFGELTAPHSDFVQQKCDNGLIGLYLYGAIIILIFLHCFKTYWSTDYIPLKMCAITAGASIVAVYATFYSDNVVNYSMCTLSMPFGFYGMMLGLIQYNKNKPEEIHYEYNEETDLIYKLEDDEL